MDKQSRLIKHISKQLKPSYKAALAKGLSQDDAYFEIYPKVVHLVAEHLGISEAKTNFEARDLLQQIIKELTH